MDKFSAFNKALHYYNLWLREREKKREITRSLSRYHDKFVKYYKIYLDLSGDVTRVKTGARKKTKQTKMNIL